MSRLTTLRRRRSRILFWGSLCFLAASLAAAFGAPWLVSYTPEEVDLYNMSMPPSGEHVLGTDELGRDILARLLYGGRVSLAVGAAATMLQLCVGVILGALGGYYGGWVDAVIVKVIELVMCFPFFVIAITLVALFGPSAKNVVAILGLLLWPSMARLVRAEILKVKRMEFVQAAVALGFPRRRILLRHIFPHLKPTIVVYATLSMAVAILSESSLSFLGLGVRPPMPSWGNMLAAVRDMNVLRYEWWIWVPPGAMILLTVLGVNFVAEGLRNPRL